MKIRYSFLSIILLFSIFCTSSVIAQNNLLGKIEFPNSGADEAQADFQDGVMFMHNFEYEDAARAFQRAREIDPDFALAYYGEAKSHNHPIWQEQDREAAMEVLQALGETVEERQAKAPTQREKDFLMSMEILYGNTDKSEGKTKEERDFLYRDHMKEMHMSYPNDHEVTTFYALSILGTAHEGRDFGIYMQAAAELMDVWNANAEHPGAAHYLIHSFDDPIHAPLGLPMAKAYSKIAPSAAHAQHMTSHIFLALGMWDDVINANVVASDVYTKRKKELGEEVNYCGHYTWWLQYGYLQEGDVAAANKVLMACSESLTDESTERVKWHFSTMRGHQVVDTENWDIADEWTFDYDTDTNAGVNYYFTSALGAIHSGDFEKARKNLKWMMETPGTDDRPVLEGQLKSLLLIEEGKEAEGLALLKKTVEMEDAMPIDFGPPTIVKPSLELLGDVLLEMGEREKAADAYKEQLVRTPKRRHSVLALKKLESEAAY